MTKQPRSIRYRVIGYGVITFAVIVGIAFATAARTKRSSLSELDARLLSAATTVPLLFAPDYQDRAAKENAVCFDEDKVNRQRLKEFLSLTSLTRLYTLVSKDDGLYFSASSTRDAMSAEQQGFELNPYLDAPASYFQALNPESDPVFFSHSAPWGTSLSVAIPLVSPGGMTYLSCADMDASIIQSITRDSFLIAFGVALVVALLVGGLVLFHLRDPAWPIVFLSKNRSGPDVFPLWAGELGHTFLSRLDDPAALLDLHGTLVYSNPSFTRLFPSSSSANDGGERWLIDQVAAVAPDVIEDLDAHRRCQVVPCRLITKDEGPVEFFLRGTPMVTTTGVCVGYFVVLTDQRRNQHMVERRLIDEKFRAVSTLAAAVAHDFNNALMVIQGNLSLLKLQLQKDPEIAEFVGGIGEAVKTGTTLTRQLFSFYKGYGRAEDLVDLRRVVFTSATAFAQGRSGLRVEYSVDDVPPELRVYADGATIDDVFLAIMQNADTAMGGNGQVMISYALRDIDEREGVELGVSPGLYISVAIADRGPGMDEETRLRAFDPYFTTRPKGQGRGLGLSKAFGILRSSGGALTVESELGVGTVCTVLLRAAPTA